MVRIIKEVRLHEAINAPSEGIFWYIADKLIALMDKVDINNYHSTDLLHINAWKSLRKDYKVDGRIVPYNYFPRGRVMVIPIFGNNHEFKYYDVTVYIDKCIDTPEIRDLIEEQFTLYLKTCKVSYDGQLGLDGSHYVCHNCAK